MEENKNLLRKIIEIFNTGDLSEVDSLFFSDYTDYQKPHYLTINGPEEFKQIVLSARKSLCNLQVTIEDVIVQGDKIAARLHWHSTDSAGKTIERETIDILRFENGKAVEHWGAEVWKKEFGK